MNVRHTPPSCLDACAPTPLFRVDHQVYTWRHVLAFAEFRGELAELWERTRYGLAASQYAEAHDLPLTADDLEQAAEQLRYRLKLITADDTINWLADRKLTLDAFESYLWRNLLRQNMSEHMASVADSFPVEDHEVAAELWTEALLGGDFARLATLLAGRAAVQDLALVQPADRDAQIPVVQAAARSSRTHRFAPDNPTELVRLEAGYQAYVQIVASPDQCRRRLRAQRSQYVEIEYELASFASWDVASEAHMCVTLDGEPLSTVAERAMCGYSSDRSSLDELTGGLSDILLSAEPGEYLEPFEVPSLPGYHIVRVIRKHSPSLDDAEVLERLRQRLTREALEPYLEYRVNWLHWRP